MRDERDRETDMSVAFARYQLAGAKEDGIWPHISKNGAFLGCGTPLLEKDTLGRWRPRAQDHLQKQLSVSYGTSIDLGWRMTKLSCLAHAMNKGDLSLAAILLVHLELPALKINESAQWEAFGGVLEKYNPDEPRDERGRWTTDGDQSLKNPISGNQIALGDPLSSSPECQEEWLQAMISCRALEGKGNLGPRSGFGSNFEACVRGMVSSRCGGNPY